MEEMALKSFLTLFVVMDPVGLVPMYVGLSEGFSSEAHRRVARRAVVVGGAILLSFALFGSWLLGHLGITLAAFQVAGGLLLLKIAIDMVFAQRDRSTEAEAEESEEREDISVFPLAIPFIAGPGAMASVMILCGEAGQSHSFGLGIVLACMAVVLAMAYFALRVSSPLSSLLGQTGINVITRILGVLLAALAIQYIGDGVVGFGALG